MRSRIGAGENRALARHFFSISIPLIHFKFILYWCSLLFESSLIFAVFKTIKVNEDFVAAYLAKIIQTPTPRFHHLDCRIGLAVFGATLVGVAASKLCSERMLPVGADPGSEADVVVLCPLLVQVSPPVQVSTGLREFSQSFSQDKTQC